MRVSHYVDKVARPRQAGFTLAELLIVVAIILVLLALAGTGCYAVQRHVVKAQTAVGEKISRMTKIMLDPSLSP